MALTNLNNNHLAATNVTAAKTAITQLETALASISVNLTAEDRQKYGSINEQNKLFVNKVYDYNQNQPTLSTAQVTWTEFNNDYSSRLNMENLISRLESLTTKLKNAKILHDYDNFQAALVDYAYTNFMAGTGAAGYETKQNDLKQFFSKTTEKKIPTEE
ncbi:MAG TPA: hypothetical protein VL859_03910 [Flavobacterium sp.]|nr:hypothetical protein [Flavobacterium sp.]